MRSSAARPTKDPGKAGSRRNWSAWPFEVPTATPALSIARLAPITSMIQVWLDTVLYL